MVWKPPSQGLIVIASYMDYDLNGKRIVLRGCSPSWERLAPNLIIPEGHLGTLTGIVELHANMIIETDRLGFRKPSMCNMFIEVCWDDLPDWHYTCSHEDTEYREYCLIDIFVSRYKMTPNFLHFVDEKHRETCCIDHDEIVQNFISMSVYQDPTIGPIAVILNKIPLSTYHQHTP